MSFKGELGYLVSGADLKGPFFKGLKKHIAKDLFIEPGQIITQIKNDAKILLTQDKKAVDPESTSYLEWAAILVACDDVLLPIVSSNEDRYKLMQKSLYEEFKFPSNTFMKKVQSCSDEKLKDIANKTIKPYGNKFTTAKSEGKIKSFIVNKCLYHEYFNAKHKPYLTKFMCDLESKWYSDLGRDNPYDLRFKQDEFKTLADGNSECIFSVAIVDKNIKK
ncbi:MAG: hypothetical protein HON32_05390 [Francisellaceae bacterium]|jgi:hypothetical protein|nr:hypothetical protein [Francisellaceae bacterium]MBT6539338.1 hypothetical protein [Francisellaceae bacterium]